MYVRGMTFSEHGVDFLCSDMEHDILITWMGEEYMVHVHDAVDATVLAGPFRSTSFDVCAVWAQNRAGKLRAVAQAPAHLRFVVKNGVTGDRQVLERVAERYELTNAQATFLTTLQVGEALDLAEGRQILRVQ